MRPSHLRTLLCIVPLLVAASGSVRAQTSDFQKILESYAAALDANDVETLVGLYSPNGVFMAEGAKAALGQDALRAAYKNIFATLKVGLKFTVQETEHSGDLGWARALSTGTVKVLATGTETQQSFNLLAVFRRESGTWKIRNYLYASDRLAPGEQPK